MSYYSQKAECPFRQFKDLLRYMWDTGIFPLCLTATVLCPLLPRRCLNIHKTCGEGEGGVVNETELKYPGVADYPKGQNSLWV